MLIPHVEPGDLIKADDWNSILEELTALEARIATIEASLGPQDRPQITGRIPAGAFESPGRLTLLGSNFEVPLKGNTVLFDGLDLLAHDAHVSPFILDSDDTKLVFEFPEFSGLPRTVTIAVRTRAGLSNSIEVPVTDRKEPVRGTTTIRKEPQNIHAVQAHTTLSYLLHAVSVSNVPVKFSFAPSYNNPKGSTLAAWEKSKTRIVDEDGNELTDPVTIESAQTTRIGVRLEPPSPRGSVEIGFSATAVNSDDIRLTETSPLVPITLGKPYKDNPDAPTMRIKDSPDAVEVLDGFQSVWRVKHGTPKANIPLNVTFAAPGDYAFEAKIIGIDGFWRLQEHAVQPPTLAQVVVPFAKDFSIFVANLAEAATTEKWTLEITATWKQPGKREESQSKSSFLIGIS